MNRRFFLLAAPAIVAAPSLMKVSAAPWFAEYRGFRLVALHPGAVNVVRIPIRYGAGIYSGYDGYEIVSETMCNAVPTFFENMKRNRLIAEYVKSMSGTQSA